ncbi:mechanosensitive ion channel family protein [Treponema sp. OttesenSCG-928-L16]|nr:mechanosensitive ion channel family protein [Treponema sp. OttesenSCG-928-L16]
MDHVLSYEFLGNTARQWILALAFIIGGCIAGKIVSLIITRIIKGVCPKTKHRIDDIIFTVAQRPLVLLVSMAGFKLGIRQLILNETADLWFGRIYSVLVIIILAWTINKVIDALILEFIPSRGCDGSSREIDLQPMLRRLFKTIVWIFALILILKTFGYNISAILAGLGLGGAALALAAKDTLANFFGSITVFVDRPFKLNDRIKISGFDGYITEMGFRTSRLRTLENRTIIIPNSIFTSSPIENISSEPNTRITQTVSIARSSGREGLEQAAALLKEICAECSGVDGQAEAGISSVSGAAFQMQLIYYIAKDASFLDTQNRVNLEILRRFEEAGITLV